MTICFSPAGRQPQKPQTQHERREHRAAEDSDFAGVVRGHVLREAFRWDGSCTAIAVSSRVPSSHFLISALNCGFRIR